MSNKIKKIFKIILTKKELDLIPSSFDMIGNTIIYSNFPKLPIKSEKVIGEALISNFPHIVSVFKKTKKYSGKFRTPKLKLIAGKRLKETIHRENNVKLKLNIEKVYYSPRSSEERKRIFNNVKSNEIILVMFSGCGVYPLTISKNSKAKKIIGVEMNPIAHKYALENLELNKVKNVEFILGDVNEKVPKLKGKFDRILMPLPKGAEQYLSLALFKIRKKGIIHFYTFSEENSYKGIFKYIETKFKSHKKNYNIKKITKCGQFSPRVNRICIDIMVK